MAFVFLVSLSVVCIEVFKIVPHDKEIEKNSLDIGFMEGVIEEDRYFSLSYNILNMGGKSIESILGEEEELTKAKMYSINTNLQMQNILFMMGENLNEAYEYTNIQINISGLDYSMLFFDETEGNKLKEARSELLNKFNELKRENKEKEFNHQGLTDLRNLLYVSLVVLTGIGAAFRYFLDKKIKIIYKKP